jgi:predicted Zn-dependent peptidase
MARAAELDELSGIGEEDLLGLIREVRRLSFPEHHALHRPLPGSRAALENLDRSSTQNLLAWDRLHVGVVGPWEAVQGIESVLNKFGSLPSSAAAEIESEIAWDSSQAGRSSSHAGAARRPDAFVIAVPSVPCEDSHYAAISVANALLAHRLRTLQRDSRVLYARSFLDKTFVQGLWYVYASTASAEPITVVERVHELAESVQADGPDAPEVDAARTYLWEDRCRMQGPLRRAALAGSVIARIDRPMAWEDFLLLDYQAVTPGDVRAIFNERFCRERAVTVFRSRQITQAEAR